VGGPGTKERQGHFAEPVADLFHDNQRAVLIVSVAEHVVPDQHGYPAAGPVDSRDGLACIIQVPLVGLPYDRRQKVVLGAHVVVQRSSGHTSFMSDLTYPDGREAFLREQAQSCRLDQPPRLLRRPTSWPR
jgi:hypothetical protein